jgi:hypothetical protein
MPLSDLELAIPSLFEAKDHPLSRASKEKVVNVEMENATLASLRDKVLEYSA